MHERDDEMATDGGADGEGFPTVLVGGVALAIGAIAGIVVGFLSRGPIEEAPEPPEVAVVEGVVGDAPEDEAVEDELSVAQARVAELEREVVEKSRAVSDLEVEMDRRAGRGAAMAEELRALKTQLANAKSDLKKANNEKDQLIRDLRMTEAELVKTRRQRDFAREDALFNRWQEFLSRSQLEICDHGRRKRIERCRETSMAAIDRPDRRDRFAHCVRSGQAAPVIMNLEKDAAMPDFSEMLDENEKATKGWMIVYCDPTLPERDGARLAERHLSGANITPDRATGPSTGDGALIDIPPADAPD